MYRSPSEMSITIKTPEEIERCGSPAAWPRKCSITSSRMSGPASPPQNSTACAMTTWSTCRAPSRLRSTTPRRATALPQVDLRLGQPPGLPRRSRRQGAEEGRHRQSRHHRHQGRLARRHQPHVHRRRRRLHPGQAPVRGHLRMPLAGHRPGAPGAHLGDIGHAIQRHAEANGFSVVREFCGHGIGRSSTKSRRCCTTASRAPASELRPGMIFTIEPMINAGKAAISELPDGWTIVTGTAACRPSGSTPCW
jgi:hypothetical protein